ncbi:MAG: hypothetical protein ACLQU2_31705 [Candidatus Binataceae bacterium]
MAEQFPGHCPELFLHTGHGVGVTVGPGVGLGLGAAPGVATVNGPCWGPAGDGLDAGPDCSNFWTR